MLNVLSVSNKNRSVFSNVVTESRSLKRTQLITEVPVIDCKAALLVPPSKWIIVNGAIMQLELC